MSRQSDKDFFLAAASLVTSGILQMNRESARESKESELRRTRFMKERLYERKRVLVDKITTEMEVKGPSSQLEALLAQVLNSDLSIIPEYEQCFEEISTPIVRVPAGHIVDAIGLMLRASTIPNKPELKEDEKKVCVKFKDFQREANNSVCAICLEKYEQEDEIEIRHCSHTFHKKCLKPWENSNRSNGKRCPCCRQ